MKNVDLCALLTTSRLPWAVVFAVAGPLGACGEEAISQIPNQAPVAVATAVPTAAAGASVLFGGSASNDNDGTIVDFAWDFGDASSGAGALTQHSFDIVGSYAVTLKVTDNDGATDSALVNIVIDNNAAPTAIILAPNAAAVGQNVRFDGGSSSDSDGQITSFSWDFDDGTTATDVTVDKSFGAAGIFVVTLSVTDDKGSTASAEHTITIGDTPPSVDGEWRWFLTDESLRNLGLACGGSFHDSQLTILANGPQLTVTEHAGGTSVPYSGTVTGQDFAVENVRFTIRQEIVGTFTSATEFSGVYKIDAGGNCADRPVSGIKL